MPTDQTVVFPTDYSPASMRAFDAAVSAARDSNARLIILHVETPDLAGAPLHNGPGNNGVDDAEKLKRDCIRQMDERLAEVGADLECEHQTAVGDPEREIVGLAERVGASMIVMSTTGRSGLSRLFVGSVAEGVVRHAPCPVLTVRTHSQTRGDTESGSTGHRLRDDAHDDHLRADLEAPRFIEVHEPVGDATPSESLLSRAATLRATDIHIDPVSAEEFQARFRIDGRLEHYCWLSREIGQAIISQLKIMANIDIAEPFHPKEGRLRLPESLDAYQGRISIAPVLGGEAASVRLLYEPRVLRRLESLGFNEQGLTIIKDKVLRRGEGLVLATGPTGAGKTSTLYSMLHSLQPERRNIVTIEDPVEVAMPWLRQMNVDHRHGVTFAAGLHALMRMDPDIIAIGEIRDGETADIAMRAAGSGKYVFSTLQTRDAAAAISTLRQIGIDARSLAAHIAGIISQRLVRRLCEECREAVDITPQQRSHFQAHGIQPPDRLYKPIGCRHCHNKGYKDRVGAFEIVLITPEIASAISSGRPEDELRTVIRDGGITTLAADGLAKAKSGVASFEDATRMTWVRIEP